MTSHSHFRLKAIFCLSATVLVSLGFSGLAAAQTVDDGWQDLESFYPEAAQDMQVQSGAATSAALNTVRPTYSLMAGDLIDIEVANADALSGAYRISEIGTVELPLIGAVDAAGLSVVALEKKLEELYTVDYLVNPRITVSPREMRPMAPAAPAAPPALPSPVVPRENENTLSPNSVGARSVGASSVEVSPISGSSVSAAPASPRDGIIGQVYIKGLVDRVQSVPVTSQSSLEAVITKAGGAREKLSDLDAIILRTVSGQQYTKRVKLDNLNKNGTASFTVLPGDTITLVMHEDFPEIRNNSGKYPLLDKMLRGGSLRNLSNL